MANAEHVKILKQGVEACDRDPQMWSRNDVALTHVAHRLDPSAITVLLRIDVGCVKRKGTVSYGA